MKLNLTQLKRRCLADFKDYADEGEVGLATAGNYIFKDQGASILAVAHLDTVQHYRHFYTCEIAGDQYIFTSGLDDRLGAYIILDLLPRLGVKCDILLTEGEEHGMSTAEGFTPPRDYNWIFSFDRTGTDVVMYQYENAEARSMVEGAKMKVGFGSYSDIADLEQCHCLGFNFGTGYYNNHDRLAYANLTETRYMVKRFLGFWGLYANLQTRFVPPPPRVYNKTYTCPSGSKTWTPRYPMVGDIKGNCDLCGAGTYIGQMMDDSLLCSSCYDMMLGNQTYRVPHGEKHYEECEMCGDMVLIEKLEDYHSQDGSMMRLCHGCSKDWRKVENNIYIGVDG